MEENSDDFFGGLLDTSERSQRFKRRLDYAESSNDEDEEKPKKSAKKNKKNDAKGSLKAKKRSRVRFSEEEVADMWLFVIDRLRHPVTQKVIKMTAGAQVWKAFKNENKSSRNELNFYVHFRRTMVPALDMTNFDMPTKTLLHYSLEIPCSKEFIRQLREEEKVEVDVNVNSYITAYRKIKNGVFHEEDIWDEVWGEDAIANGGSKHALPSAEPHDNTIDEGLPVTDETLGSPDNTAMEAAIDQLAENVDRSSLADQTSMTDESVFRATHQGVGAFGEKPKKTRKKRKDSGMEVGKMPEEREKKRKYQRKDKFHLVEHKKQKHDAGMSAGYPLGKSPMFEEPMGGPENTTALGARGPAGMADGLQQMQQSWAAVYTPLMNPYDRDAHSPELGEYSM